MRQQIFVISVDHYASEGDDPAMYLATNDELGLVVEASTLDELGAKILQVAPVLFELNCGKNFSRSV